MTTLGDLLFAGNPKPSVSEREWTALVQGIAAGDRRALHALYHRMHPSVFTFLARITNNRETAEELALNVFYEIWRRPSVFSPAVGSVVGWVMNLARSRAIERLRFEQRKKRAADEALEPIIGAFVSWPAEMLCPAAPLWERLAQRIAAETGQEVPSDTATVPEPEWQDAAPGLSYGILARDVENERVSMLVRLASGAAYPRHIHAGVEELYLLEGELFIDGRKLYSGDYNRAEQGSVDQHVWSATGCMCVLLTSTNDVLR